MAAFLGCAAVGHATAKRDAAAPTLTQVFKCSQPTGEQPVYMRDATLMNVQDKKTGASHFELRLDTMAAPIDESSGPVTRDAGKVAYPQGANTDEGIAQAVAYCMHNTVPPGRNP